MRSNDTRRDQPRLLRRKTAPALGAAWYYMDLRAQSWQTEIPLEVELNSARLSWLKGKPKPVPCETTRKPDSSSKR